MSETLQEGIEFNNNNSQMVQDTENFIAHVLQYSIVPFWRQPVTADEYSTVL